jgi:LacI family transcriptional regulator
MKSGVSLSDIANALGVSKTLVSMVLNNKADENGISKQTQKRVLKFAKEINYKPNLMARGLRMGVTNTIGLVVSDIANPFYSKMARFIEDKLAHEKYHLVICSTDEDTEKERKIIRLMREKQFDGIVISSSQKKNDDFKQLLREYYPFVLIDRRIKGIKANFVGIDNFDSTYRAVQHLIKAGYKNISAFAVSPAYVSSIKERISGYQSALKDAELINPEKLLIEIPFDQVKHAVKKEIIKLTQPDSRIDAIFAINNNIAVACLETFKELKIKVPQDLAFIAFDDIDAFKLTTPQVTAIDQPLEEICANAVSILMNEINKPRKVKKEVILEPTLIIRESVLS